MPFRKKNKQKTSEPSCSKLTMSLVNDSLKFTSSDTQICWNFLLKNVSSFCNAKATHIFSAKNIRILYIEFAKTVNEMTLYELVKLTMLWTTGPWYMFQIKNILFKDSLKLIEYVYFCCCCCCCCCFLSSLFLQTRFMILIKFYSCKFWKLKERYQQT